MDTTTTLHFKDRLGSLLRLPSKIMLLFNYLHSSLTYIGIKLFQRQFKNYLNAYLTKYVMNQTHHELLLMSSSTRPTMDSMHQMQFTLL